MTTSRPSGPSSVATWLHRLVHDTEPSLHDPRVVEVDLDTADDAPGDLHPRRWPTVPAIVVGRTGSDAHPDRIAGSAWCDVVLPHHDPSIDAIRATVAEHPIAALTAATLLRVTAADPMGALLTESAAYSTLQAGPEFARWRSEQPALGPRESGDALHLLRSGPALTIVLDRPHVRNALNLAMRDQLVDALALPELDPSIGEVHLRGAGPSYSAGGDLTEFGAFTDPATAHLVRLDRNVGEAALRVGDRTTAHLHGHCIGSGIEIPAFAARVVADPDTTFALPEASLGLIPGAGGTVSIPRRIGRHRTAWLILTGATIAAPHALAWGLVDAVEPVVPAASRR